ncbi:LysR substrate-binding domain-containing protein [Nocardia sp. NPDC050435]|uniref:LysR family transcriptional regulator n=1 Tax=Nocardia sp. NPDC050435 TaxID=3155040 RepID=UPI0033D49CB1
MSRFSSIDVVHLRWFVAVAEELHFARAAKALRISRQRLSQTVIDLEAELDTKLFVPGASPTQLTDDGRELLAAARELIVQADAAGQEQTSDRPAALRVGFVPGVTVSKWTRIWAERFPETPLEVIALPAAEQLSALREGRVDMCFVRLPIDRDGLSAIPLYRELPVVVVPKEHPISLFTEVGLADLADEKMQDGGDIDGAAVLFEMVAAGVGQVVVPHSIARLHARRDLVYRTVTDAPDTEIALAWPTAHTSDLSEEFVGVVRGRSERSSRSPSGHAEPARNSGAAAKSGAGKKSGASKKPTAARKSGTAGKPAATKKKPLKRRGR